jgi:histidyl-tRNA synthetase
MSSRYEVPRGTRDFLPDDMAVRNHVERIVRATFESYGFQQIQTPTFELYDLFAAQSGEEIRESMFTFASDAGRYALRPELTAPVCRVVSSGALTRFRQPYKLYYLGPCFRYGRPQAGRYREFYQAGVELLGSREPLADAEIIRLAVKTLANLDIRHYRLKIGNVGIFRRLLDTGAALSDAEQDRQNQVIHDIDRIMHLREKGQQIAAAPGLSGDERIFLEREINSLHRLQGETGYSGPHAVVPEKDAPEERLRERARTLAEAAEATHRTAWIDQGLLPAEKADLFLEVARLSGPVGEVLARGQTLLAGTPAAEPIAQLARLCELLRWLGVTDYDLVLGVARNLDYYTGMVFEIDSPLLEAKKQLCGGGRYDGLVKEFGGGDLPATGFAFGFDRLVDVFEKSGQRAKLNVAPVDVVVVAATAAAPQALEAAELLRGQGLRVGVDLLGHDLEGQVEYARGIGAGFCVHVGLEAGGGQCRLRRLSNREEKTVPLAGVAEEVRRVVM